MANIQVSVPSCSVIVRSPLDDGDTVWDVIIGIDKKDVITLSFDNKEVFVDFLSQIQKRMENESLVYD